MQVEKTQRYHRAHLCLKPIRRTPNYICRTCPAVLPLVGISFFRIQVLTSMTARYSYMNAKGLRVNRQEILGFVTKAGSQASNEEVPSIHKYLVSHTEQFNGGWNIF